MKKILITGADGFTGRYLAANLSQIGYEVHGLVHSDSIGAVPGVAKLYAGNLLDLKRLEEVVGLVQPEKIAHLAAIAFVAHGDVDAIYRTNVVGTRNLLEALVRTRAPINAVLLASSANIYGNSVGGILDESTPAAPANDYAVSKLAMEYVARLYAEQLPLVVTRPFNYTGVGQASSFLIPKIASHVSRRTPIIELGNINVARDFSDVRMVVQYYERLLNTPAAIGGTFNVCSGTSYTLQQVLDIAKSVSGHDFQVQVNPAFVRANEVKLLQGDSQRLIDTVGAIPAIPLEETVRWMLETPT